MHEPAPKSPLATRFRGFLPVVVDVETGGINAQTDALLEIAAVLIGMDHKGYLYPTRTIGCHVQPFPDAKLEPASMAVNKIDPHHPFRFAIPEAEALRTVFKPVRNAVKDTGCSRAILVGHNASFDLSFVNAAVTRNSVKRNPFHPFSSFDTVTLAALAFGQTVLARSLEAAGIAWNEREAHSAIYDAECTANLFCHIVNRWKELGNWIP